MNPPPASHTSDPSNTESTLDSDSLIAVLDYPDIYEMTAKEKKWQSEYMLKVLNHNLNKCLPRVLKKLKVVGASKIKEYRPRIIC